MINFFRRVLASIFRHGIPSTFAGRVKTVGNLLFLHIHPPTIRPERLRFSHTWCMGGITFLLFLVLTVTGVLLMFYYRPTVEHAYGDVQDIMYVVPFGRVVRNLHRWAADAMIITVFLHMFRVFLKGAYKPPREFNWVIGVLLLVTTLLLYYTGYVLPWDELGYWAATVGSGMAGSAPVVGELLVKFMLGDDTVGQPALLRAYVWHCVALPLIAMILMALHFWRTRKDAMLTGGL